MSEPLTAFGKGHEFPPISFGLSREWVADYVAAVDDGSIASHRGSVPPMALAALAVRTLLESARLPEGAVHVGQEVSFHRAVQTGESLVAQAKIASRGERAGWVLMALDLLATAADGDSVMRGRATLTFPAEAGG